MSSRGVGSFSFVDEAVTLDYANDTADQPLIGADVIVWRNGRIGMGRSSRSGLNVYDTASFDSPTALTLPDVRALIKARVPASYAVNRKYYDGDHWQGGAGWSGPMPPKSDENYTLVRDQVKRAFRSKNAIREVIRRHVMAVVGKEPAWYYIDRAQAATATPTVAAIRSQRRLGQRQDTRTRAQSNAQNARVRPTQATDTTATSDALMQVEQAVTAWWDKRGVLQLLQQQAATTLLSGRSVVRLFIPTGAIDAATSELRSEPQSLQEALDLIYIHEVPIDQGTIVVEGTTMQEVALYAFTRRDATAYGEIHYLVGFGDDAQTLVATIDTTRDRRGSEQATSTSVATYPLGGRLLMFELTREMMITQQVREQQQAINEACTMARVNGQTAGFVERTVLNGQVPGYYKRNENGTMEFIRTGYETGAGSITFIAGIPQYDAEGIFRGLTQPSIVYKDPVSPETFDATRLMAYRDLLDEVDQLHHLLAGDKYLSGEARKQARADFITSLRPTRAPFNAEGQWLLETLYALAYALLPESVIAEEGLPDPSTITTVFQTQLDAGPATTEEVRSAIEVRTAKLASRQTTQQTVGIEDTDAENALIAAEEAAGVPWPGSGPAGQLENGGRTAGSISNDRLQADGIRPAQEAQT